MESLNVALRFNNMGARALESTKLPCATVQLTKSMNLMREAFGKIEREGLCPTMDTSDCASGQLLANQPCASFSTCRLPELANYSRHFICADAIYLTDHGISQMITQWKDMHICSSIVTFNVALMYHIQGLMTDEPDRNSLRKARRMYRMAHELLFQCEANNPHIRRVAWRIKLSSIYNLSQIHLLRNDTEIAQSGFQYLAWIINIAQRDVCLDVLGPETYQSILQNSMLYSMSMIAAPAA